MTDIWHEPTETPTEHKTLLFDSIEFDETEMGVYSGGLFHSYNEFEPMTPAGLSRWAYLSDFINCQKELADTKKKLDLAIKHLEGIRGCDKNGKPLTGVISCWIDCDELAQALEQINQKEEK